MIHKSFFNLFPSLFLKNLFDKRKFNSFAKSVLTLSLFLGCLSPFRAHAMGDNYTEEVFPCSQRRTSSRFSAEGGLGVSLSSQPVRDDALFLDRKFFQSLAMVGGSPPKDPNFFGFEAAGGGRRSPWSRLMEELKSDRLRDTQIRDIRSRHEFARGSIRSFFEVIRRFYGESHYPDDSMSQRRTAQDVDDETPPEMDGADAQDRENVMRSERINRTNASIEIIYNLLREKAFNEESSIGEIRLFLDHLRKGPRYSSFARRDEMNEVDNAFHTLERSGHQGDYDSILLEDAQVYMTLKDGTPVTMKSLLARTWRIINDQFTDEQDLLKEGLVRALGQCIEDDGHRVCNSGKSQRIVNTLQGHVPDIKTDDINDVPESDVFLRAFFSSKQAEIMLVMERSRREILVYGRRLFEEIKTAAEETYRGRPHKRKVLAGAMDFLRLSLEIEDDDLRGDHEFSKNLRSAISRWEVKRPFFDLFIETGTGIFVKGNIQSFLSRGGLSSLLSSFLPIDSLLNVGVVPVKSFVVNFLADESPSEEDIRLKKLKELEISIGGLFTLLRGQKTDESLCLKELYLFLEHLQENQKDLSSLVNAMDGIDKAFFVLKKLEEFGASGSFELESGETVTPTSLALRTWWVLTQHSAEGKKTSLKKGLVRALAQCIGDDGNLMDNMEILLRLSHVPRGDFQGPSPHSNPVPLDSFLSKFFTPEREKIRLFIEKPYQEKMDFASHLFENIRREAQNVYGDYPGMMRKVDQQTTEFLISSLGL